ncbi:hypothetical protein MTO96_007526 [Rhipicephalus appendiculatus]
MLRRVDEETPSSSVCLVPDSTLKRGEALECASSQSTSLPLRRRCARLAWRAFVFCLLWPYFLLRLLCRAWLRLLKYFLREYFPLLQKLDSRQSAH